MSVDGTEAIIKKYQPKTLKRPVTRFLDRSGISVLNEAKVRAPVDTGLLRSSLAKGAGSGVWEMAHGVFPKQLEVGTRVFYAPFQEFGTSRGVPAKRFMQGGMKDARPEIGRHVGTLKKEIIEALD